MGRTRECERGWNVVQQERGCFLARNGHDRGGIVWTNPWLTVISFTQVFTGAAPFDDRTPEKAMEAIGSGERPLRPAHLTLTDELWGLMQTVRCLDQDPILRPQVSEVSAGLHGS